MTPKRYCARPHISTVDFDGRFVAARDSGIDAGTPDGVVHLAMGDLVPRGLFDRYALGCLYGMPEPHAVETHEHALTIPELRAAMVARGTDLEPSAPSQPIATAPAPPPRKIDEMLEGLTRRELVQLCEKHGIKTDGNKPELQRRLAAVVA